MKKSIVNVWHQTFLIQIAKSEGEESQDCCGGVRESIPLHTPFEGSTKDFDCNF